RLLPAIALAAASYAAGAGLAMIFPVLRWQRGAGWSRPSVAPLGRGRHAVIALVLARQTASTRRPLVRAGLLLMASFLLTVMTSWWGRGLAVPLVFVPLLLPSLIVLLLAARLDAALLAFLPAAGYRPGFIALAVSALPAGSLLAGAGAFLLTGQGIGIVVVLALAHLAFILIGIARAWLYPGRTRRSVDFQLQLEVAGLVAAAILLPPLAIAAAGWRFWHFHRHCRARRAGAIGFAPDVAALPESLTGRELFAILGGAQVGLEPRDPLGALRSALAFDDFFDQRIFTLSAGMRQRLAIFCAFLTRPRA